MKSSNLFEEEKRVMPGGVSSPVRAIRPYPFYTKSAHGSRINTVDGVSLIDCCLGYGPLILGHAHPVIRQAIASQLLSGWLYGTPTPLEPELARMITQDHPGLDMVRFVSTGAEATMAAIRVARGFTGKQDIVKVDSMGHMMQCSSKQVRVQQHLVFPIRQVSSPRSLLIPVRYLSTTWMHWIRCAPRIPISRPSSLNR
jgi:glutamate-1-semialdehyde 2,1-aminomutase